MKRYEIMCSKEQAIRALKLGAPIECVGDFINGDWKASKVTGNRFVYNLKVYKRPTSEQIHGWFIERGLLIMCIYRNFFEYHIYKWGLGTHLVGSAMYNISYKHAILAAIDKALDILENKINENNQATTEQ